MRVAILGSWHDSQDELWALRGNQTDFIAACRGLGAEIVQQGHTIIASSDDPKTADYHAVQGAIEVLKTMQPHHPQIEAFYQNRSKYPFQEQMTQFPQFFSFGKAISERWETAQLSSMQSADSILIIGGARGSFHAGQVALYAHKRIALTGAFGGAGLELIDILETGRDQFYPNSLNAEDLRILRGAWSDKHQELMICALGICNFPQLILIHGRSNDRLNLIQHLTQDLGLPDPIVMRDIFGSGKTLPEQFEALAANADGAIILATPDDLGGAILTGNGETIEDITYSPRARQNVWLEAGWVWGHLKRHRMLILVKNRVEIPSDLQGIEFYSYNREPSELSEVIQKFIESLR